MVGQSNSAPRPVPTPETVKEALASLRGLTAGELWVQSVAAYHQNTNTLAAHIADLERQMAAGRPKIMDQAAEKLAAYVANLEQRLGEATGLLRAARPWLTHADPIDAFLANTSPAGATMDPQETIMHSLYPDEPLPKPIREKAAAQVWVVASNDFPHSAFPTEAEAEAAAERENAKDRAEYHPHRRIFYHVHGVPLSDASALPPKAPVISDAVVEAACLRLRTGWGYDSLTIPTAMMRAALRAALPVWLRENGLEAEADLIERGGGK